jgi:hypothetical protein
MSFLQNFSKILIFKNSPESKFYFDTDGTTGPKIFNQTYPLPNIADAGVPWPDTLQPNFVRDNLLHTIGVEESQALGYDKSPTSFGQAYLDGDEIILKNDDVVATIGDLPTASTHSGETYVVTANGIKYLSDGTNWINKGAYDFIGGLSSPLVAGDYIFYGPPDASDPNDLLIAGKIDTISTTAFGTDSSTLRITLEKSSGVSDDLVDLYYYRKSWNGKNIPVDVTEGFYILIGVEQNTNIGATSNRRTVYPWLDPFAPATNSSNNQIVNTSTGNKTAFTDLIRIRRISKKYISDENRTTDETIPCTIKRTNVFDPGTVADSYFSSTDAFPYWCAYFVNPYGGSSSKLDKGSTYIIEINEMLPAINSSDTANDTAFYTYVKQGVV